MRIDLDPDLLRAFVAVADHRGFTRAARSLNRTQSAVSMQIKRLEAAMAAPLFERGGRAVQLTRQGESLIGYARRILDLNDEAFPTAVETHPHSSSRGAKDDDDGPGQIANPDIAEAEVTEKPELLAYITDEFIFEDFGPGSAVTHPAGHKQPDDENHSDGDADNQWEEPLSGHRNVNTQNG